MNPFSKNDEKLTTIPAEPDAIAKLESRVAHLEAMLANVADLSTYQIARRLLAPKAGDPPKDCNDLSLAEQVAVAFQATKNTLERELRAAEIARLDAQGVSFCNRPAWVLTAAEQEARLKKEEEEKEQTARMQERSRAACEREKNSFAPVVRLEPSIRY